MCVCVCVCVCVCIGVCCEYTHEWARICKALSIEVPIDYAGMWFLRCRTGCHTSTEDHVLRLQISTKGVPTK